MQEDMRRNIAVASIVALVLASCSGGQEAGATPPPDTLSEGRFLKLSLQVDETYRCQMSVSVRLEPDNAVEASWISSNGRMTLSEEVSRSSEFALRGHLELLFKRQWILAIPARLVLDGVSYELTLETEYATTRVSVFGVSTSEDSDETRIEEWLDTLLEIVGISCPEIEPTD